MPDKAKRKTNPRRRLLLRLILGIVIIIGLISVGIYALRPKGVEIVFIAPDDNDADQIWIANLNDPENPRQLTHFTAYDTRIVNIFVVENGYTALFFKANYGRENESNSTELIKINLRNGEQHLIESCNATVPLFTCIMAISPDGQYILSQENVLIDDVVSEIHVYLTNLETDQSQIIYEFELLGTDEPYHYSAASWIGETNNISINLMRSPYDFAIYNTEQNQVVDILPLEIQGRTPHFSHDGSRYAYFHISPSTLPTPIIVRETSNPRPPLIFNPLDDAIRGTRLDWHPDNINLLISKSWVTQEGEFRLFGNIYMLNTDTQEIETLISSNSYLYYIVEWNIDAGMFLYEQRDFNSDCNLHCHQIAVFDMDTREEILLPLFGSNSQWVNGGR